MDFLGWLPGVQTPAGDGAITAQPTTMGTAGGDGFETASRRVNLPGAVVAPAGDGVIAAQPTTMNRAGGDGFETAGRRVRLPS